MTRVTVGVHVHAEPERLRATLAALRATTPAQADILLLPDGPDTETSQALGELDEAESSTVEARGAAACFNRLAAKDADVIVLLESGSLVTPGWLDRLLDAFASDPQVGLAGPSTNRAWNEQCAFPDAGGSTEELTATAAEAAHRFGSETRSLEPLYSLSDFCYAVRREVIEAIGAADEGYGLGPCWELEYNARAARAGFRGVWVPSAYVYRAPFTARRAREEASRFEASRRRYQDALCGLKLRGARAGYEPHCRGDACEHFAPRDLIRLKLPLAQGRSAAAGRPEPALVSCIMPTRNRRDFALQAIRYFQRQDYPRLELVVVDDGDDDLEACLPGDERIRYLRAPVGESIGAKRNRACEAARGSVIAHWDDDDWYGPRRLSVQVEPLLAGEADLSGLRADVFFDLGDWSFWTCTPQLHERLFVGNVHGGTLVYRREVWEQLARYPDLSLAEDAWLLWRAARAGARVRRVEAAGLFVYLRHGDNSWAFQTGRYLDAGGWLRIDEPDLPPDDRAFYLARARGAAGADAPLVSCVMPTRDRRRFVAQSISYFLRQDYANRELLVLDDGDDRVGDLIPDDPRIRYVALDQSVVLGAKRNLACRLARGEILLHWDDDDWQAPHRITYQVGELARARKRISGSRRELYLDSSARRGWLYEYPVSEHTWLAGNTFCYRRDLWEQQPFPEVAVGEDMRFVGALARSEVAAASDYRFLVGLVHDANASAKDTSGSYWREHPVDDIHRLLGSDLPFYLGAGGDA